MTDYTITVVNESSNTETFVLCVDNANLSGFQTNVYYLTPQIPKTGSNDIPIQASLYAVCGLATPQYAAGSSVRNSQSTRLQLFPQKPNAVTAGVSDDVFMFLDQVTTMGGLKDGQLGVMIDSYQGDDYRKNAISSDDLRWCH